MAFNEPDACFWGASCMSPQSAVDSYRTHMQPFASRASLGAPAVTSDQSGGLVGLNWLREFLNRCDGCKIDFVPIHWYGVWNQDDNFRQHVQNARDIAGEGRKIWITEVCTFPYLTFHFHSTFPINITYHVIHALTHLVKYSSESKVPTAKEKPSCVVPCNGSISRIM